MSWTTSPLFQHLLPHHLVSRLVHRAARCRRIPFRSVLLRWFVRRYGIDMTEALEPRLETYSDFNSLFTRALRPDARVLATGLGQVCCPVDGTISQIGRIEGERIFQAKGQSYTLDELLGGQDETAPAFAGGQFATLYLCPRDYHRVHMPLSGTLREMVHVPGRLFSVAPACVQSIPRLFARNERVVNLFESEAGPMAVVLVGAINVGSIETVWAGEVAPRPGRKITTRIYPTEGSDAVQLDRGEEMGRFNLGSTVILLFGPGRMVWDPDLKAGDSVRMGQALGRAVPATE